MTLTKKATVGTGYIVFDKWNKSGHSLHFYVITARILTPNEMGSISLLFLVMTTSIRWLC